jgi:hypothetical protein
VSHFVSDSPEAQKAKKRSRVSLVSYLDSPAKQVAGERSGSDSDFEMSDTRAGTTFGARDGCSEAKEMSRSYSVNSLTSPFLTSNIELNIRDQNTETQRDHLATTAIFKRLPVNSLTRSFSTANICDVDDTQAETISSAQDGCLEATEMSRSHSVGSLTPPFLTSNIKSKIHVQNTGTQLDYPAATTISKRLPVNSPTQSISTTDYTSADVFPTDSDIENQRQAQASQEKRKMKSALKVKIQASAKPKDEHWKLKNDKLREFRLKLARDQINGAAGPSSSSMTRKSGRCSIKIPFSILTVV